MFGLKKYSGYGVLLLATLVTVFTLIAPLSWRESLGIQGVVRISVFLLAISTVLATGLQFWSQRYPHLYKLIEEVARQHVVALVFLGMLVFSVYSPYAVMPPTDGDSIASLTIASVDNPLSVLRVIPGWDVAYRPVPYLSLVMQYQLFGLLPSLYFFVNLLIWFAVGVVAYFMLYHLTQQAIVATLLSGLLLLDERCNESLYWIIERQSSMAVLFGLMSIGTVFLIAKSGRQRYWHYGILLILLLLAVLSKEYALAFCGAIFCLPFLKGSYPIPKSISFMAVVVVIAYWVIRISAGAQSASSFSYCADIGFFEHFDAICFNDLEPSVRYAIYSYNIVATLVSSLFPSLFAPMGMISINPVELLILNIPLSVLALAGWIKKPRLGYVFLVILFANSILNFSSFRDRNQLVGIVGVYMLAGIGLAGFLGSIQHLPRLKLAVLGLTLMMLFGQVHNRNIDILHRYNFVQTIDPCQFLIARQPELASRMVVLDIKSRFHLSNPTCEV